VFLDKINTVVERVDPEGKAVLGNSFSKKKKNEKSQQNGNLSMIGEEGKDCGTMYFDIIIGQKHSSKSLGQVGKT